MSYVVVQDKRLCEKIRTCFHCIGYTYMYQPGVYEWISSFYSKKLSSSASSNFRDLVKLSVLGSFMWLVSHTIGVYWSFFQVVDFFSGLKTTITPDYQLMWRCCVYARVCFYYMLFSCLSVLWHSKLLYSSNVCTFIQ